MLKKLATWPFLPAALLCTTLIATLVKFSDVAPLSWRIGIVASLLLGIIITTLSYNERLPETKNEDPPPVEFIPQLEMSFSQPKDDFEPKFHQLRAQFDEKSEVLNQTRKDLFLKENELLALHKEMQERALEDTQAIIIQAKQIQTLEEEVLVLEEIITEHITPKKKAGGRPRKKAQEVEDILTTIMK